METWIPVSEHWDDTYNPVITTCNAGTHNPVIPARDAGIQPYFHFYIESKIRDSLCSLKSVIPARDAGIQ
ncbi:hypothetical protein [Wolbachia endosymbiont of Ctenocephalides felis wCfeJ]|uniref:hypothetical protein n=1 Tax=Wolbachia endosymbiont of Ctenocephalides felis wCfeJ TaxID=2732594 RepID=UPI001446AD06|nr:hypothetical protein [Wolbachia endosymbiont of Ctenocephalides felis wCfeJ]WCR57635.1 MAG: hypothetical protein PG980_000107 [Wolbachia endosymbiont of Ctenocephalides felis wCfeJ]